MARPSDECSEVRRRSGRWTRPWKLPGELSLLNREIVEIRSDRIEINEPLLKPG